jgi:hypothetical protein
MKERGPEDGVVPVDCCYPTHAFARHGAAPRVTLSRKGWV